MLYFLAVMNMYQFNQIKCYLYFNNNAKLPINMDDKLYKIQMVYNLNAVCWCLMNNLGEQILIDEDMMKWREG